jgi:dihydrodipicolinate synthase/N-acetylneuraminate lyase
MAKGRQSPPASGVYVALATPRQPDSIEADAAALLDYMDIVVRAGVNGVVLFGSTGEFVHFDAAERMRTLSLAIRRSRVPVLVNVSHSTLAGAVELAQDAVSAGAAGLLLMPPYFYRYNDDQVFAFYQGFARMLDGKTCTYLYNLPFFTNAIGPELAERLLTSGAFAGIKDSSGDLKMFDALRDLRLRMQFSWLAGNESLYVQARTAGADGIVSGVAAALPELVVALDRAVLTNDMARTLKLNGRLSEFLEWVNRFPATVGIKQAAVARGWKLNHFAFPLDRDTQANLDAFHRWLGSWLPSVLSECAEAALAMKA